MTRTQKSQEPRIYSHLVRSPGDSPDLCLAWKWGKRTVLQDRAEPQDTQEVSRASLRGCVGKPSLPSEPESFLGSFPCAAPTHSGRLLVRIPPRLQGALEGPGHGETGLKSHTAFQRGAWGTHSGGGPGSQPASAWRPAPSHGPAGRAGARAQPRQGPAYLLVL